MNEQRMAAARAELEKRAARFREIQAKFECEREQYCEDVMTSLRPRGADTHGSRKTTKP